MHVERRRKLYKCYEIFREKNEISISRLTFMKCQNTGDKEKAPKELRKEIQVS